MTSRARIAIIRNEYLVSPSSFQFFFFFLVFTMHILLWYRLTRIHTLFQFAPMFLIHMVCSLSLSLSSFYFPANEISALVLLSSFVQTLIAFKFVFLLIQCCVFPLAISNSYMPVQRGEACNDATATTISYTHLVAFIFGNFCAIDFIFIFFFSYSHFRHLVWFIWPNVLALLHPPDNSIFYSHQKIVVECSTATDCIHSI